MATIEVLGWKDDFTGFTGWDAHARSELRRRLRKGINASQAAIRRIARQLDARQLVCLTDVRDEAVHGITQMLQTSGAELCISLQDGNNPRLFRWCAKRR
jgi:hypothetical protein